MLGYIKPAYGELRVREHEFYRAAYCGLCRSMGKCTGCLSQMTLSYDFVFLALVRYALAGERIRVKAGRCIAHPLKRRPYLVHSDELAYSAGAAAVLMRGKIIDDINDEGALKRTASRILLPFADSAAKRAELPELSDAVHRELTALSELEAAKCKSIDEVADCFGRLLGSVVSFGLDGANARIAYEIGKSTGRLINIIDAADDMAEDARKGRYNPFVLAYGDEILEEREVGDLRGGTKKRTVPKREIAEGILTAARLDLIALERAENLIEYEDSMDGSVIRGIIGNIIGMGMQGEMMRVLGLVPPGSRFDATNQRRQE